ncbi:hypothetical protein ACFFIX_12535 [Metabacillus herbersteinensis]|uniref:Uncharacterized protein n=1 Tax=Metabacillus herbersteinensis TaxID=283816 RepID=A0ABV6GFM5_9BACI
MDSVLNSLKLRHLESGKTTINIKEEGYYAICLKASASTSWQEENNESLMIRISVDKKHHQDMVLFYGRESFIYKRLLGKMKQGTYDFEWICDSPRNNQAYAEIESLTIEKLELSDQESLAVHYAPTLFGRSVYSRYDNLFTDIPLEMIYFFDEWDHGKVIEYHMVFSHEDEGTPAVLLMSKWGRLLDIEYMARVYLNDRDEIDHVDYQGPEHKVKRYKNLLKGEEQIFLQTATCNGNFTDEITSDYSFSFIPSYEWKLEHEAREVVMEKFPYINQVMRWEAERQLKTSMLPYNSIQDVTQYIYIQSSVWDVVLGQPTVDILYRLKGEDEWHSSSLHDKKIGSFSAAYTGPYHHFATAIRLPEVNFIQDIEEIKVVLINEKLPKATVRNLKVLAYTEKSELQQYIKAEFNQQLNQVESEKVIWRREK